MQEDRAAPLLTASPRQEHQCSCMEELLLLLLLQQRNCRSMATMSAVLCLPLV
jgi:hypothetical protein